MKRKELLLLSVGIFATVVALVIADIYHIQISAKVQDESESPQLKNYKIDKKLLDILESKTP